MGWVVVGKAWSLDKRGRALPPITKHTFPEHNVNALDDVAVMEVGVEPEFVLQILRPGGPPLCSTPGRKRHFLQMSGGMNRFWGQILENQISNKSCN